jgi:hypothetical protein
MDGEDCLGGNQNPRFMPAGEGGIPTNADEDVHAGNLDPRSAFFMRSQQRSDVMMKYVLPVALLIGATAPAFAAEYYIVRGSDQKCKIVEMRPSDKTVTVIGDKAYVTRDEAQKQIAVVCKDKM